MTGSDMLDSFRRWTKTQHEVCQEDLSAYLDGELTPRERAQVERHLDTCAQCRSDVEALRHTVDLLRMVPTVKPPRSFLLPAGQVVRQQRAQRRSFAYGTLRLATAVATVLLVLVVSGDALLRYALPAPDAFSGALRAEPTVLAVELSATSDEATGARVSEAQPAPQAVAVETLQEAGTAVAPAADATSEMGTEPMAAGEVRAEATPLPPGNQLAVVTKARPSRTSAVAAAPPAVPTQESVVASPSPAPETLVPTATPLPPTATPVPPTPIPEPTATVVPPTAIPQPPEAAVAPPEEPAPVAAWLGAVQAIRPVLPVVELALAAVTLALLAITLWVRRQQRTT